MSGEGVTRSRIRMASVK